VAGAVIKLDCSKAVLQDVIEFIYTEQVNITDVDTAIELLGRAEEYFLPDLKKRCEEVLVRDYLTEDTASSLMRVAGMYRTPGLKVHLPSTESCRMRPLSSAALSLTFSSCAVCVCVCVRVCVCVCVQKACVSFLLSNVQSINVAELDKVMLAELLKAAIR
jgi:hypothetical protein